MAGPPHNISEAQLWAEITAHKRPYREVDFPRNRPDTGKPYCKVALIVLTPAEEVVNAARADEYVKKTLGIQKDGEVSRGYNVVYDNAAGVQTLYESTRRIEDHDKHFFPSADALRDVLTTDELAVLIEAYAQMRAEIGPILSTMTQLEMDAWLDVLEAGAERVSPLYLLSPAQKNDLIYYCAAQLRNLRKDNS